MTDWKTPGVHRYASGTNSNFLHWAEDNIHALPMAKALELYTNLLADPATSDATLAALGLIDRVFLLGILLGRRDIFVLAPETGEPWLYDRIREVEADPTGHIDLWAREHYKSTVITFAGTIQDLARNPEETIGIFSHTRPVAKRFLAQIKTELEINERLKRIYSDVFWTDPRKQAAKWSEDDGITVKRKTNPKEASVEASGLVDGQPTGKHFSKLKYDDVVVRESVTTPEMIQKTTKAWEESLSLGAHGGTREIIGTRWHTNDTYRSIMDRGSAAPRLYPATKDGTEHGTPVFLSRKVLNEKRKDFGPYTFAAQMLQNPSADKVQGFKRDWLRYWYPREWGGMNRYIIVDPASKKKKSNDYTVILVIGLASDGNYYIIDWVRDRLSLTERTNQLIAFHRTYLPLGVGYEEYGMQADIEHIEYVQTQEHYSFDITPLGGRVAKEDRIKGLIPIFENSRMFLPAGITHTSYEGLPYDPTTVFVNEEYSDFPVAVHDDAFDCVARILDGDMEVTWPTAAPTNPVTGKRDSYFSDDDDLNRPGFMGL